jgi:hypothetical protein
LNVSFITGVAAFLIAFAYLCSFTVSMPSIRDI